MKVFARSCLNAVALPCLAVAQISAAHAAPADDKPGSAYLQCDGQPNNMTTGESAARLLGAVTLLALFAPPPEAADASKRKFGAEGVAVCDTLLTGDKKEGNPSRRIGLILARALHRIEAKDYEAAIADAHLAHAEAETAGLLADPYYVRSAGRASDLIEAAALYRMKRPEEARAAALRATPEIRYSALALSGVPANLFQTPDASDAEARYLGWRTHAGALSAISEANRLEEWGRFAEAAKLRDAVVDLNRRITPDLINSEWLAESAVAHALAGDTAVAAARAAEARANVDSRRDAGKPEASPAEIVEILDLYAILEMAGKGDLPAARRLFAARSQWVAASFGSVVETTRRLRAGAKPDEMIGGLAKDAGQLWQDRSDARLAEALAKDSDNKTLFWMIPGREIARSYQSASNLVWRTDKSKLVLKLDHPEKSQLKLERMYSYAVPFDVAMEAYTLHAALLAKQRGQQGFIILPIPSGNFITAGFLTGNRGDPGLPDAMFNDADAVIAELRVLIPDPETLKTIRAQEAKKPAS